MLLPCLFSPSKEDLLESYLFIWHIDGMLWMLWLVSPAAELKDTLHHGAQQFSVLSPHKANLQVEQQVKIRKRENPGFRIYLSRSASSQSSAKFKEKHLWKAISLLGKDASLQEQISLATLRRGTRGADGDLRGGQQISAESSCTALVADLLTEE